MFEAQLGLAEVPGPPGLPMSATTNEPVPDRSVQALSQSALLLSYNGTRNAGLPPAGGVTGGVGGVTGLDGVTGFDGADAGPDPTPLTAVTVNV